MNTSRKKLEVFLCPSTKAKANLEMLTRIDHQIKTKVFACLLWGVHKNHPVCIYTSFSFKTFANLSTKHLQTSRGYGLGNREQVFLSLHSDGGRGGEGKNFPPPTRTLYLPYMGYMFLFYKHCLL